jgi:peroxiredoxin
LTVAAAAAIFGASTPRTLAQTATNAATQLRVGQDAPDFKLQYFDGTDLKDVSLSQYRGKKNVIVAFYIFAFTGG